MELTRNIEIYGTNYLCDQDRYALDDFLFDNFDRWLSSRRLRASIVFDAYWRDNESMIIKIYDHYSPAFPFPCRNYKQAYEKSFSYDIVFYLDKLIKECVTDTYWKDKDYICTDIMRYINKEEIKQSINNIYGYKKEENNMPPKSYYSDMFTEPSQAVKDESRHKFIQSMEIILGIRDVKFNDPATIVFWDDGTKTVVKCQKGDKFDPEKGLAMAIVKKQCGHNHGYFNKIFQKWCPDEEIKEETVKESKRPTVFIETAEEYKEEVKKLKKIGDGYDDIRWEVNKRGRK